MHRRWPFGYHIYASAYRTKTTNRAHHWQRSLPELGSFREFLRLDQSDPDMATVLVVDDSATMRRMVVASLRSIPDTTFSEAANGLEAIECLAVAPVHLVVLDLNMPDMHGLEVVGFIRQHATFKKVPIIVLTTRGDDESRTAAVAAGATLYMTKPFEPAALAEAARRLLNPDVN
jgi:two-component system chemotaxis response regulator CheY